MQEPKSLKKHLTLFSLTLYGVGLIIGAGIYSILGAATAKAGESLWLSFLIAGSVAAFTGLSYAELSSAIPKAAAEYSYMERAFPKLKTLRFAVGLLLIFAAITTATTVALSFASYFQIFFDFPKIMVALLLLILMGFINILGIREATWVNIVFTFLEVFGLLIIIYFGFSISGITTQMSALPTSGVFSGASLVFFAYLGFEHIANLSEETKDAERVLPRAIFWSIGITSVLYSLVAFAVLNLVSVQEISQSENPLAVAALTISPALEKLLSFIALGATLNTVLVSMLVASRMIYGMSQAGTLPRFLTRLHHKKESPYASILVVLSVAILLLPLKGVGVVAGLASWAALLGFSAVNTANIVLRRVEPKLKRPFRLKFSVKEIPVVSLLGLISCLLLLFQLEWSIHLLGLGFLTFSMLFYFFQSKLKNPSTT